jgi:hypothetical protein
METQEMGFQKREKCGKEGKRGRSPPSVASRRAAGLSCDGASAKRPRYRERRASSAAGVADILGLQQQDLAELAGVHRNTLRTHPESPRLQSALRDLMRVLSAAVAVQPDPQRAIFLVKNEPIPAFRHKTLLQLVQEGRTEDAVGYLESIGTGFVG